ncbi:hypothetical protein C1645_836478 [Glomus cerebriforme]|uniref:Galactose oxidase n=1 Tax=Glomus cerebriforme TaxID=658196 RepID=A0A397S8E3_9GLOM|nr:hypothetical protein C1645_836478 [Glomus cerebriforme]
MNNLNNLIFGIIFFQIIININCQQYVPVGKFFHTATLVETKIYFLGGKNNDSISTNDFFFLDISKSFNKTEALPFKNVTLDLIMPKHYGAGTTVFGKSKNSIFFFGGDMGVLQDKNSSVYTLDTTKLPSGWQEIIQDTVDRRRLLSVTADNNNKIFLFGGGGGGNFGDTKYIRYNTMNIFNISTQDWYVGTIENTLIKREGHTGTFLSDTGEIIYIGGRSDNGLLIDMTNLDVYDTINDKWVQWSTRNPPEQRCLHTAVLTNDNRIILFGGVNGLTPVKNYYVVLNVKTLEWYHGNGSLSTRAPYRGHTATLYNDYMFIAFGQGTDQQFSDDVLIYIIGDYANFTEVNYYNVINKIVPKSPNNIIIGSIISSIIAIGFIGFIIFKYNILKLKMGKRPPAFIINIP